jgi:hypothetical protein
MTTFIAKKQGENFFNYEMDGKIYTSTGRTSPIYTGLVAVLDKEKEEVTYYRKPYFTKNFNKL